jgi:glycosyltransferase involved in cell wall biosynthesis
MNRDSLNKNSLLFITNSISGGGAERATNLLVNALHDEGADVKLIALNEGPEDLVKLRCPVFEIHRKWRGSVFETFKSYRKVQSIVRQEKPDVIVLNCDLPELIGCLLLHKSRVIVVEHAAKPWPTRISIGKLVRLVHRLRGSNFVTVSPHLTIWPHKGKPAQVFVNPVNLIKTTYSVKNVGCSSFRIVHIGRLVESKQPNWVLSIASLTHTPCAFIGSGPLEEDLKKRAQQENISAEFMGQVPNPYDLLSPDDLLLITSKNEGDGLVLVEAISLGVPFLANDVSDFEKFNLPQLNRCKDIEDFVNKVNDFKSSQVNLALNADFKEEILKGRSPKFVAGLWLDYLNSQFKLNFKDSA